MKTNGAEEHLDVNDKILYGLIYALVGFWPAGFVFVVINLFTDLDFARGRSGITITGILVGIILTLLVAIVIFLKWPLKEELKVQEAPDSDIDESTIKDYLDCI